MWYRKTLDTFLCRCSHTRNCCGSGTHILLYLCQCLSPNSRYNWLYITMFHLNTPDNHTYERTSIRFDKGNRLDKSHSITFHPLFQHTASKTKTGKYTFLDPFQTLCNMYNLYSHTVLRNYHSSKREYSPGTPAEAC